jgi:hypothetical protein
VSVRAALALSMALALSFTASKVDAAPLSSSASHSFGTGAGDAGAPPIPRAASHAPLSGAPAADTASSGKTAPSGPPLTSPVEEGGGEDTAGVPSAEGDQLVENGLGSPLCHGASNGQLSEAAQSNCRTSAFVGAPAPTNNYDLDVNIDTGALGLSSGGLLSVIQDVFIAPVWEALVWVVHALIVMLQWGYTLELLDGSTMSRVAASLREAQASFTQPWLVLVLSFASVLTVFNGLVRRRVAETLGEALLTIVLMALGLWMIADPLGTVGAVGQFANRASLGTLGAIAQGSTANAPRTLGDSMRELFEGAIEVPWCYLEFGNVHWCSDAASLDAPLRKGALSLISVAQAKLSCQPSSVHPLCSSESEDSALAVERSSALVREASTNGALFLAFPANKRERNSVKDENSLLHILCRSENDTKCSGPTAAQAEFRSDAGTFPRMIGVVLIAIGVLGMTMLFGLIAVHLLAAAILSMFLLLLAPFVVLAPAVGGSGRALFMGWLTRLLGTVGSKLIFSFLLGALLSMQRMLASLEPIGWWTQWFLISAFWWVVFLKRRQALEFLRNGGRASGAPTRQTLGGRIQGARQAKRDVAHPVRWAKGKLLPPLPAEENLQKRGRERRSGKQRQELVDGGQGQVGQRRTPGREGALDEQFGKDLDTGRSKRADVAERTGGVAKAGPQAENAAPRRDEGRSGLVQTAATELRGMNGSAGATGSIAQTGSQARTGPIAQTGSASARPGRLGASRRDRDASKSTKLERATRLAAYASAPELDEAALLASMRRRQPASRSDAQSESQAQARAQPESQAQARAQPQSRPSRSSGGAVGASQSSPTSAIPDTRGLDSRELTMRRSSEIMDDARALAAQRKRQLGLELPGSDEPRP